MASTSYSPLPSNAYVGLGSQGDLLHAANYGTYDSGVGSITSHPYQYEATYPSGNQQQPSSYSNDYLQSTYLNDGYSTQQPQYYPSDKYAQQPTHNQDLLSNDYTKFQTQRYDDRSTIPNHTDENYATTTTQPPHRTTMDNHPVESNNQHQTSNNGTTQHHSPPSNDNQHNQSSHIQSEHDTSNHPPPKHRQSSYNQSEHDTSNHPPSKHQSQPPSHSNLVRSEQQISNHSPKQPPPARRRSPANGGNGYTSETTIKPANHSSKQPPPARRRSPSNGGNGYTSETTIKPANHSPKQPPPARRRSPSNGGNGYTSETTIKPTNPPPEMKTTKSTKMRAAAIKQKEETREQKPKVGNLPSPKKKPSPTKSHPQPSRSEDEESSREKSKRNKKQPNPVSKQHKSRRDGYQTEDNNSSVDDDDDHHHKRNKSKKRTALSDQHREKYLDLPPIRRGRGPAYYDAPYDYPLPPGHPLRERHPYYDDYPPYGPYPYPPNRYDHRHRPLYEDAYDVPPYIAGYHDPYDGFFDYETRKSKSKSKTKTKKHKDKKDSPVDHEDRGGMTGNETEREDDSKSEQLKRTKNHKHDENKDNIHKHTHEQHRPRAYYEEPYYDGNDMLEVWRQERNDYLKKKYKPSVHDVLYAQQWLKSDSYLENQRRRALRDSQGYYFPYKKYTLQDYKDLQKTEALQNPYASVPEAPLDRKERAKKRHDYASQIEKQPVDAAQNKTPRDGLPKKPWHSSNGDSLDPDKASKRERALEYAKVQVVKHRPIRAPKNRSHRSDPTERYVDSLFPHTNDDGEGSVNGRNNQSGDDDDDQ